MPTLTFPYSLALPDELYLAPIIDDTIDMSYSRSRSENTQT